MTHSDIYTKFMIEYDKANITSSYPSLTDYEIATLLDKAYLALISEKLTGNNPRKAAFEADVKAIEDLQPLIVTTQRSNTGESTEVQNEHVYTIDLTDFLYYISAKVQYTSKNSIDGEWHSIQTVKLVSHENATKFMSTTTNTPWVKNPVAYFEGNEIHVLVDPYDSRFSARNEILYLTYLRKPEKFAKPITKDADTGTIVADTNFDDSEFELSDSMAEELVNLAILMAAETVESPRLTTKTNLIPLES